MPFQRAEPRSKSPREVLGAKTCEFGGGGPPIYVHCSRGMARFYETFPVNTTQSVERWRFWLRAKGRAGSVIKYLTVVQRGTRFLMSPNWSGYALPSDGEMVTDVSGKFTVPTLNCTDTPNAGASVWVGTGGSGRGTGDLLQTGVETVCDNGVQENVGWWEEAPQIYAVDFSSLLISAGDKIEAQVFQDRGWNTRLDDLSTGLSGWFETEYQSYGVAANSRDAYTVQGHTHHLSYAGGSSADWIVEDPTSRGSRVPFANFGTVAFRGLRTSFRGWPLKTSDGKELVDKNYNTLSEPKPPKGREFSVSYMGT